MEKINLLLIIGIVLVISISILHLTGYIFIQNPTLVISHNRLLYDVPSANQNFSNSKPAVSTYSGANPAVSNAISSSELLSGSTVNSNFWYNEKFIAGTASPNGNSANCNAENYITPPHFVWNSCAFKVLGHCIGFWQYVPNSASLQNYNSVTGYLGFPETESGGLFTIGAQSCNPSGSSQYNFPDLVSAQILGFNVSGPGYCLPTYTTPSNQINTQGGPYPNKHGSNPANYPNFFNWSISDVHQYSSSGYYYALNTAFNPPSVFNGPSALIVPAVSCGATFPNNYINFRFSGSQGIPEIVSLSGFTPSVGLAASGGVGFGMTYVFGNVLWPSSKNYLVVASQISNIDNAFDYTSPTLNYAEFPAGNRGDNQYINVSGFFTAFNRGSFTTPLNLMSIFFPSITVKTSISLFESNTGFASITNYNLLNNNFLSLLNYVIPGFSAQDFLISTGLVNVNTYNLPNLEPAYYPMLTTGVLSNAYTYDYFRTDGVFPFCGWNSSTDAYDPQGNVFKNCTFENPNYVNPISYSRFWTTGYSNVINDQPYAPAYYTGDQLNQFTQTMMNSFCFYGENFNETTGVYTPPSYTRIIPPSSSENYTVAIGKCNAFFNSSNCFSPQYNNYLNFNYGIFASGISCTPKGVEVQNITDAWIRSVYLSDSGGNFCGYFLGEKNLSNPTADSTIFGQNVTTCPSFSSNDSEVPLIITVKNVGTSKITNPYLIALFRDTNVSQMFTSAPNTGQPSFSNQYSRYSNFLQEMQSTNGVIEVRYNASLQTDMFYYNPQFPLNPIPLQELLANDKSYLAGPYNNSLLGLWMSMPQQGQLMNGPNVIRTANTLLVHSDTSNSGLPVVAAGGTVTFTVEVPMGVFKQLLKGKYNVSIYFGDTFNVSWAGAGSNPYVGGPSTVTIQGSGTNVEPLPSSDPLSQSNILNNEVITPQSSYRSPPWQYLVSYTLNLSQSPFGSTRIYSDSLNLSVQASNLTQSILNVTAEPKVSFVNATGTYSSYSGGSSQINLAGSYISCFASQDNIQDFSVFWTKQAVSPPNLQYAVQDFYMPNGAVSNILVNRWRGIVFMPYADQVALNYNNLPIFPTSQVSMELEKPIINQSATTIYSEAAFAYFGTGSEKSLFHNMSLEYNTLGLTPSISPMSVPSALYGFSLNTNSLLGSKSVIRIFGAKTIVNNSRFSDRTISVSFVSSGGSTTNCGTFTTNNAQIVSIASSSCPVSSFGTGNQLNKETIVLSSSTPFTVQLYNNSAPAQGGTFNLSDITQSNTIIISSNTTALSSSSGSFSTSLNLSLAASNTGITLLFGVPQQYEILTGSNVSLYYLNDTPFNCNIVNNIGQISNNAVTKIGPGRYNTPNGTILCNLTTETSSIRAVFMNATNGQYLGSGDIGLGLSVENMNYANGNPQYLLLTDDGEPVNSQNINLTKLVRPANVGGQTTFVPICKNLAVYNGIINYSDSNTGCTPLVPQQNYTINITEISGGQNILKAVSFEFQASKPEGAFFKISPFAVGDNPSSAYNLTLNTQSLPEAVPISFSLNNLGGCDGVRFLSDSPYPYAEIPYQVVSSTSGQCTYDLILNKINAYNGKSYTIFLGVSPSPVSYSDSWLNASSTTYNDIITTTAYSTDLLANCKASLGPCLNGFTLGNSGILGNLLVNNVSASQAAIAETVNGPIVKCFTVTYSASQQVVWQETGFGGVTYSSNKLYQITNPSQSVSSAYCFFNGAPVITDTVLSNGQPLSFNIGNDLISNFSFAQSSNSLSLYVPGSKYVGYNGQYSNSYITQQVVTSQPAVDNTSIVQNTTCTPNPYQNGFGNSFKGVTLPSYSGSGNFYCLFGALPTYTSEAGANNYFIQGNEKISDIYKPGVYNFTQPSGLNETLYGDCGLTGNITSSNSIQTISGQKFYVLTWPQLNVSINGASYQWVNYDPSDSAQSFIATHTAPIDQHDFPSGSMIINPSSGTLIQSCPFNTTIENYTSCIKPLAYSGPNTGVKLMNGSYDGIEGIPDNNLGNYNNSNGKYGPANYVGGGCFVNSQYSCAPTNGAIKLALSTNNSAKASGSVQSSSPAGASVSYNLNVYEDPNMPISTPSVSFSCSGWVANQSSGPNTQNTSYSCSYGSNSGPCRAYFSNNNPPQGSLNGNLIANCAIVYDVFCPVQGCPAYYSGMQISQFSISNAVQAEPTGIVSTDFCGNITNPIGQNLQNGIATSWIPGVSKNNQQNYPLAEVGGCEATRDVINFSNPTITTTISGANNLNVQSTYSCPSGYSGTIESCAIPTSATLPSNPVTSACTETNYELFNTNLETMPVGGTNGRYGQTPLGCNTFSAPGYSTPTTANGCVSYHSGVSAEQNSSYVLQYSNVSTIPAIGIGLGVVNSTLITNISIPSSGSQAAEKDQYLSGLSVSQYEINNILTKLYPSNLFLSSIPQAALFKSSVYPYDLLNILLLQNPYFKIYGIPALSNGSIYDYALNIFTGGTSANCIGGSGNPIDYALYALGEGQLCSGQNLPPKYANGIYLSIGALNQGLHAVQFYSVSETGNTTDPTATLYDTVGSAYSVNTNCSNGNSRSVTSKYIGGKWRFNITSDEECNSINNKLYGYIINCIYQTPNNSTFTADSQYYLAYNLPTIWNISYSLLVSPKSYNIIPVQVYNVNTSSGTSHLSFYPPTEFIETGIPQSVLSLYSWSVKYAGKRFSSSTDTIAAVINGTLITEPTYVVSNVTAYVGGCGTTYYPLPESGRTAIGSTVNIAFASHTTCTTTFNLGDLGGYGFDYYQFPAYYLSSFGNFNSPTWNINYDNIQNTSSTAYGTMTFTTLPGTFQYSVSNMSMPVVASLSGGYVNNCIAAPGTAVAGSTVTPAWNCTTDFKRFIFSDLPSGYIWDVKFNGISKASAGNNIRFFTPMGNELAFAPKLSNSSGSCTTTYYPQLFTTYSSVPYPPIPGASVNSSAAYNVAGDFIQEFLFATDSVSYTSVTLCPNEVAFVVPAINAAAFSRSGEPYYWNVTLAGQTYNVINSSKLVIPASSGGAFSISNLCEKSPSQGTFTVYSPSPSSGSLSGPGAVEFVNFTKTSNGYGACYRNKYETFITMPFNSATISILNTTSSSQIGSLFTSSSPLSVGVTPNGQYAYVSHSGSGYIAVISSASNSVVGSINDVNGPYGIAATPNSNLILVANNAANSVSFIDTTTNKYVTNVSLGSGLTPSYVAISQNYPYNAYVSDSGSNEVSVIDYSSQSLSSQIAVGADPTYMSVSPDGNTLYVSDTGSNDLAVINTQSNSLITKIALGSGFHPQGVAVTPNNKLVYVVSNALDAVSVINTTTDAVKNTIDFYGGYPIDCAPQDVAISYNGYAYITCESSGGCGGAEEVVILNASTSNYIKNYFLGCSGSTSGNDDVATEQAG